MNVPMTAQLDAPISVLRKNGKSFYWASWFLGSKEALNAARLYAFCRAVDDIADKHPDSVYVTKTLRLWQQQIQMGKSADDQVSDVVALAGELSIDTSFLTYLLDGLISDVTLVKVGDEKQLLQYAFLVAGTVGIMMCYILGASDPKAKEFAIDLGIAMQLTNILRDVTEDAVAGRQYIPQAWLAADINLLDATAETTALAKPAFKRLHELAECYYASAYEGLRYLPLRSRLAIRIAARLYQEIGLQAQRQDFSVLGRRIVVSPLRKCWLVGVSCLYFAKDLLWHTAKPIHNPSLHQVLTPWINRL